VSTSQIRIQRAPHFLPVRFGTGGLNWYTVHTRARHERREAAQFEEKRICMFLPLQRDIRRLRDRSTKVDVPIFNCCAFVHMRSRRRWGFVSVAYDFLSNRATKFCQSSSSPEGDSLKAAANLYQPGVLLDSARTMYPVPDTLTLLPSSPAPTKVTSTSTDSPGSIRCGEGKNSPVLLRFCVTKGAGSGSTMPPTPFTRRGNKAVNRGWRLRSGVDVMSRHPLANKEV
jgi:hypothetical protein